MANERRPPPQGGVHIEQDSVSSCATGVVIHQYYAGAPAPAAPSSEAGAYRCMAEAVPGFVPRKELDQLVEFLRDMAGAKEPGTIGITTALQGAGGFGKTTLAQALCHDVRVREAFPGGILWTTLGEELSADALLGKILGLLSTWTNARPPGSGDVEQAGFALAEALSDQRVLVVVDDVWRRGHLAPFLHRGLCLLVTTRNRNILPQNCRTMNVDSMQAAEAVSLLARGIGPMSNAKLGPLAKQLGYWPLLLGLVNGRLRDLVDKRGLSVGEALGRVSKQLDKLGLKAFDERSTDERARAVSITVGVSLDCLDEDERRCYEQLAIFPEDVPLPIAMLARYWWPGRGEREEAEDLCERLGDLSLVQHVELARGTIRIHDVFRQYLIDSQTDTLFALHTAWLESVCPESGRWSELPVDATYAWQHLAYHLRFARGVDELVALLFDYAWLGAKLGSEWLPDGQGMVRVNALLSDYEFVPTTHGERPDAELVRDALRLSSHVLARDATQLPGHLIGRLAHFEREPETRLARLIAQCRGVREHAWLEPLTSSLTAPGALRQTFSGHTKGVNAVAVTPDGALALSGSSDGTVRVWDVRRGLHVRTLAGHTDWVNAVAVTADGTRSVSGSNDGTVKVWDVERGVEVWTLTGHEHWVRAVAMSADGKRVVSGAMDGTVKVWDADEGREERTLRGHSRWVLGVAITADGARAISGSVDGTLRVWDIENGLEEMTLGGRMSAVLAVTMTADETRAIAGCEEGTVEVWDLQSRQRVQALAAHANWVWAVSMSADGKRMVSAADDGTVKVWDVQRAVLERTLSGHSREVRAVAMTGNGRRAISGSRDGTVKVWKVDSEQFGHTPAVHSGAVRAVTMAADGTCALSASDDRTVKVWDVNGQREVRSLLGHASAVRAVVVTADGRRALSGADDGSVKVWDVESGRVDRTLSGCREPITALAMSADGRRALSGSSAGTVRVWEVASGKEERTFPASPGMVMALAVTADGTRALSGLWDGRVKIWDMDSGCETRTLSGRTGFVTALVVTADGQRALVGSDRGTISVWQVETGRCERTLTGHTAAVNALALTADGERAFSASSDGAVRLWDLRTGNCVASFADDAAMTGCALHGSGRGVACDRGGRVHFLRLVEPAD